MLNFGPFISGAVAIGIFQLAQQAGSAEVSAFAAEIKATKALTAEGEVPMANWMGAPTLNGGSSPPSLRTG